MSESLLWLVKTNMPKLSECIIKSKTRLNIERVGEQVSRKYPSTAFKTV